MAFIQEFKNFAVKGNVADMAVGIIIGAAFGKIVSSLVSDVMMPVLGVVMGTVDFSDLALTLKDATETQEAVVVKYGQFLQVSVDFIIVAFAVFLLVKGINRLKQKEEASEQPAPAPAEDVVLLREIRDLLKQQ